MTTFARRLTIWTLLSTSTEPLSIAEMARRTGVSKNTVQRDLDALSAAGVPVVELREGQRLLFTITAKGTRPPTAVPPAPGPSTAGRDPRAPARGRRSPARRAGRPPR
jgi:predicted DNA-binding transcriptional regulator YafY